MRPSALAMFGALRELHGIAIVRTWTWRRQGPPTPLASGFVAPSAPGNPYTAPCHRGGRTGWQRRQGGHRPRKVGIEDEPPQQQNHQCWGEGPETLAMTLVGPVVVLILLDGSGGGRPEKKSSGSNRRAEKAGVPRGQLPEQPSTAISVGPTLAVASALAIVVIFVVGRFPLGAAGGGGGG